MILQINDLHKSYFGKKVLGGISLEVPSGSIFGLLGPNGSGKTTILKIVAGLLHHYSGTVLVCGNPIGLESKKIVSFLPDRSCLYDSMTAQDAIGFYADFFADFDRNKAFDMLDFMQLEKTQRIKTMSKGMVEKMNLTLTFSRAARLFILDEPLGGTDPVAREKIIKTWTEDSAILLSTHLVGDIEHIFTDVAFIKDGAIVLQGGAEQLRASKGQSIHQLYIEVFS